MKTTRFFKLKVHARASREELVEKAADAFEIFVREPAEAGHANRAVLSVLGRHLGVAPGRLWIVKGAHQPSKIVALRE